MQVNLAAKKLFNKLHESASSFKQNTFQSLIVSFHVNRKPNRIKILTNVGINKIHFWENNATMTLQKRFAHVFQGWKCFWRLQNKQKVGKEGLMVENDFECAKTMTKICTAFFWGLFKPFIKLFDYWMDDVCFARQKWVIYWRSLFMGFSNDLIISGTQKLKIEPRRTKTSIKRSTI